MHSKLPAAAIFLAGVGLLVYTWWPIVEWQLIIKPKFTARSSNFLSPLAELPQNLPQLPKPQEKIPGFGDQVWQGQDKTFFLTIEKFGIERAKVATSGDFLTQLAHLPGTALPGEAGNVFISGHSVLPQFFTPDNYLSIFSKLYLLEAGDAIILENDRSYVYQVSETLVVGPSDTWVISPPESYGAYLTLLTCGVGGFTSERIIIRATLQNFQEVI